ncbi:polysaccharide pyruvyl transferase family protein [Spirosoma sp. HMF4905]|uniref:Polysaccharide pyruvyl transferase family protein n=1 Tax=Spirosoma arboris TaxID=2682092 RepID=A0A7K1SFM7_9BACT|nr:polysaccharide pyruvyl transferase family protein [Spirosoma arboris]MVM32534.1 polysaccharide pyruvyl transferase family protein [Spirosoma arboris]
MKKIIELRGVEFHNKGAELMLYAIVSKIRERYPDSIIAMQRTSTAPMRKQRKLDIYTLLNKVKYGISTDKIITMLPKYVRRKLNLIAENEVNIILDASGFAYGDFWGYEKARYRLTSKLNTWKENNKKIILMPQAFGPFESPLLKEEMSSNINLIDLIFARDKYSYESIVKINDRAENVYLMPDFTNILDGKTPEYLEKNTLDIGIIPNNKLVESKVFNSKEEYIHYLTQVVLTIQSKNRIPYFLIHEGEKDLYIANKTNENLTTKVKIIKEDNPLYVKGIIGSSKGIITSRFHGLVSALSQAIPCLCLGWSHKYKELLEDYNYPEGLIQTTQIEEFESIIKYLIDKECSKNVKEKLKKMSGIQKLKTDEMWNIVFSTIE